MKTITLKEAVDLLENSVAVIIPSEHNLLIYPSVNLKNDDENPFFHISWDTDGLAFGIECFERDNPYVKFDGSSLYFTEENGDELKVTLLQVINYSSDDAGM